jgi:hypothetical protein
VRNVIVADQYIYAVTRLTRHFFLLLAVIAGTSRAQNQACDCPLSSLSHSETEKYEVIFRGTVKAAKVCGDVPGSAQFEVNELYKGRVPATFEMIFTCEGPCATGFHVGEEWIIYTNFLQLRNGRMDWCSRSRKYFKNEKEDHYAVNYGSGYFEEASFLRKELGLLRPLKDDSQASGQRNIRPDFTQSVIILLCSLAGVLLFYWLFRKFFK